MDTMSATHHTDIAIEKAKATNSTLPLTRTTLRLNSRLKRIAEERARQSNTTLQDVFNQALEEYLDRTAKRQAKLIFHSHSLGRPLDNLTRDDYYDQPG